MLQTLTPTATFIAGRGAVTTAIKLIVSLIFFFSYWILHKSGRKKKLPPGSNPWPIIGNLHQLRLPTHRSLNYFADKYGPIFFLRIR
jgi:flavonoid 3'-monooxygenase